MKRILVAIDFSEITPKVVAITKELAIALKAKVDIVHIDYLIPFLNQYGINHLHAMEAYEIQINKNKDALRDVEEEIRYAGVEVKSHLLQGTTIDSILNETVLLQADMIIVGAHAHGKLHNMLFGNIHDAIINRAECPILIIPHTEK